MFALGRRDRPTVLARVVDHAEVFTGVLFCHAGEVELAVLRDEDVALLFGPHKVADAVLVPGVEDSGVVLGRLALYTNALVSPRIDRVTRRLGEIKKI